MALRSEIIPTQDSLDKQLRRERRKVWFINILLLIFGVVLGGILGSFGSFDWLRHFIENLL
jgi:hypothetical protein